VPGKAHFSAWIADSFDDSDNGDVLPEQVRYQEHKLGWLIDEGDSLAAYETAQRPAREAEDDQAAQVHVYNTRSCLITGRSSLMAFCTLIKTQLLAQHVLQRAMSAISGFTPDQQRVLATGMQQLRGMISELHHKASSGQREITEQDVRDAFAQVARK
jgi:hypothetical protein